MLSNTSTGERKTEVGDDLQSGGEVTKKQSPRTPDENYKEICQPGEVLAGQG